MDENTEESSPFVSETAGQTWMQCWENEIISLSGLNLENNHELSSLVEDKEIAARAVAFVVNSTRKGIVPLCADVANLMRAKRSLEKKVLKLKKENDVLLSNSSLSRQTSHSISPTPASLSSTQSAAVESNLSHLSEQYRPCSRCSQCSSTVSNSPKSNKQNRQRLASLQHSPASSHGDDRRRRHSSPRGRRSCATLPAGRELTTTNAIIHTPKEADLDPVTNENPHHTKVQREATLILNMEEETNLLKKTELNNKHRQKTALSGEKNDCSFKEISRKIVSTEGEITLATDSKEGEISVINQRNVIEHDNKQKCSDSELSQCTSKDDEIHHRPELNHDRLDDTTAGDQSIGSVTMTDHGLEEKFMETVMLNSKLAEDLGAARKEIEVLKGRLRELEMNQLARDCSDQLYFENEVDKTQLKYLENKDLWLNNNNSNKNSSFGKTGVGSRLAPISAYYSQPLTCCKCSTCRKALDCRDEILQISDVLSDDKKCFSVSHKLQVQLNDHVVVKGDRTGYIRYIGHLDGLGQPNMIFVGLELDAPVGNHDGFCNGRQYFTCDKEHGIFVPLQEIICKVGKKIPKKSQAREDTARSNRKKNKSPDKNSQNKQ